MTAIQVVHAGADYSVIVGSVSEARPRIAELAAGSRLPLITDARVFSLHGALLEGLVRAEPILVPEGEAAKDWGTLAHIIDSLAALDVKRGSPVVALGGGSVGDVAGFAASLFKRGCPIIHVPTTLLAQADSAIGGKTAIDAAGRKNLAGTFHHPLLVVVDPSLLDTLDQRQMRSGYAEVVKYGLIDDPDFFAWCETNGENILAGHAPSRCAAIEHCIKAKARFVAADAADTLGERALLNLGHTFGHAIEALAGHDLLHGEAVAIGLSLAFRFSVELGLCQADDAERLEAHLRTIGLPVNLGEAGFDGGRVFAAMQSDKKATASGLTLILARGIGKAFVAKDVDQVRLADFLERQS